MTALILDVLVVGTIATIMTYAGRLLGPAPKHEGDGNIPYETGVRPIEHAEEKISVLYWKFAVLFVVFDVDLALLFPWALSRPHLTLLSVLSVTLFVLITALMVVYFWAKGVLECR